MTALDLWTSKGCFYLDGVSFVHKTNPLDQARGRIYRKKSEGLDQFCTSKGSKVGSGGKVVKFIVAISYNEGVLLCKDYEHMNASFFILGILYNAIYIIYCMTQYHGMGSFCHGSLDHSTFFRLRCYILKKRMEN